MFSQTWMMLCWIFWKSPGAVGSKGDMRSHKGVSPWDGGSKLHIFQNSEVRIFYSPTFDLLVTCSICIDRKYVCNMIYNWCFCGKNQCTYLQTPAPSNGQMSNWKDPTLTKKHVLIGPSYLNYSIWVVVSNIFFMYHPYLRRNDPNLTTIFSDGLVQPPTIFMYCFIQIPNVVSIPFFLSDCHLAWVFQRENGSKTTTMAELKFDEPESYAEQELLNEVRSPLVCWED